METLAWDCQNVSEFDRNRTISSIQGSWNERVVVRDEVPLRAQIDGSEVEDKKDSEARSILSTYRIRNLFRHFFSGGDDRVPSRGLPGLEPGISADVVIITLKNIVFVIDLAILGYKGAELGSILVGQIGAHLREKGFVIREKDQQMELSDFIDSEVAKIEG